MTYPQCLQLLRKRLAEPAPARIQLLSGPRQVGKTTLLLELARTLGDSAVYLAADGPEAALPGFWERTFELAGQRASCLGKAVLLLDEVHLVPNWAARLKGEWDRLQRLKIPLHIVATGSSALRLGGGSRESLAGRFERLTLSHWTARALADTFGIAPTEAAETLVAYGSFPGAFGLRMDFRRWTSYIREAILEPALSRDLLALAEVRRPALLRQVFAVCASSPAAIVSLQKIQGQLQDRGALETVAHYLELLQEAFLVAAIPKFSARKARQRSSPPKLVVLNNAVLSAVDPRGVPDGAADAGRFGAWVENACLAHAWCAGQSIWYWREEPFEVDAVIEGDWGALAMEIKTGHFTTADLKGLSEFTRRHRRFRPLVVCDAEGRLSAERAGFSAVDWRDFLLSFPSGTGKI